MKLSTLSILICALSIVFVSCSHTRKAQKEVVVEKKDKHGKVKKRTVTTYF